MTEGRIDGQRRPTVADFGGSLTKWERERRKCLCMTGYWYCIVHNVLRQLDDPDWPKKTEAERKAIIAHG